MSTVNPQDDANALHVGRYQEAPIGAARKPRGIRWRRLLVVFMRLAAAVWMLKGLMHWLHIMGLLDLTFPELRLSRQGIIMSFAVLDLVAAVGLWLVSSWGAALWLMVLAIEAAIPFLAPDLTRPFSDAAMALIFAGLYLFLVWRALREERGS